MIARLCKALVENERIVRAGLRTQRAAWREAGLCPECGDCACPINRRCCAACGMRATTCA